MSAQHLSGIENTRTPDYEIHPLFLERWSPRAFSQEDVAEEVWLSILEAARWAPSSSNLQPWRFLIARTPEDRAKFHAFIAPSNREWCDQAPLLVLLLSYTLSPNGQPSGSHAMDTGTAWGYMALEATNQGLITHAMAGFNQQQARVDLHIPDDYAIHAVIAVGYQGDKATLSEKFQERELPSSRRPITESLYEGDFGQAFHR